MKKKGATETKNTYIFILLKAFKKRQQNVYGLFYYRFWTCNRSFFEMRFDYLSTLLKDN